MRCFYVLLVVLLGVLANSETHTTAKSADAESPHVENTEERGAFSSLKSNVANWAKMKYWVSAEKADYYVKKKLELGGLKGAALTNHPKYKTMEKFWYKVEGRQLDNWFDEGLTLYGAWTRLRLDRMRKGQVMQSNAYKTYVRYVKKYDNEIYRHKNSFF